MEMRVVLYILYLKGGRDSVIKSQHNHDAGLYLCLLLKVDIILKHLNVIIVNFVCKIVEMMKWIVGMTQLFKILIITTSSVAVHIAGPFIRFIIQRPSFLHVSVTACFP